MIIRSINPANLEVVGEYPLWDDKRIEESLASAIDAYQEWKGKSLESRLQLVRNLGSVLRADKDAYARMITIEMGKVYFESLAEIEKCAATAEFLSEKLLIWLADEIVDSTSRVAVCPIGLVLGVMPWNFPFWQVFRFAIPALALGNVAILKHASNVFGCAKLIEDVFLKAGFPQYVFQSGLLSSQQALKLIGDARVRGVSLTGSTAAGRAVAETAGRFVKKCVLELGGSDPYIILDDADIELAALKCANSRTLNAGQSCISAKRFIVTARNAGQFTEAFLSKMKHKISGDPFAEKTDFGPLARVDLRDELHVQVQRSIKAGSRLLCGGEAPKADGAFYPATILSEVKPDHPAFQEELFGPVAAIIEAENEDSAFELANTSRYGLGSAIFSRDKERALLLARERLDAGMVFVNDMVQSSGKIPFGGVKESGYGRELGRYGVTEFANVKSIVG